jgi:hypothetical protein
MYAVELVVYLINEGSSVFLLRLHRHPDNLRTTLPLEQDEVELLEGEPLQRKPLSEAFSHID